jgi:drug/metabolite transporter (DMT)-like permease
MYEYLIGLTVVKSSLPYIRKYVLDILESHEMMFITACVYMILVVILFIYKSKTGKQFHNYKKLTWVHVFLIVLTAFIALSSTMFTYELDKYYNTPFLNTMLKLATSVVVLFLIGTFLFKEKYTYKHMFGVALMLIGALLTQSDNISSAFN